MRKEACSHVNLLEVVQLGWGSCGWKVGSGLRLGPPVAGGRTVLRGAGENSGGGEAADL